MTLLEKIRRSPPQTQNEACALAASESIRLYGRVREELIRSAATGLARGLFGPAFQRASVEQKAFWVDMAEREYRKACNPK